MTTLHGIFSAESPMGQLGFRPFHDGAVWATDPLRGVVMKLDACLLYTSDAADDSVYV